jgi:hypothetical protein
MLIVLFVFVGFAFAGGWCAGYIKGEARGIKDTERRWSDAVGRAGHR